MCCFAFIQETQAKAWQRLQTIYKENVRRTIVKRLNQEINTHGLLYVLRNGIKDRGVRFFIVAFRPVHRIS